MKEKVQKMAPAKFIGDFRPRHDLFIFLSFAEGLSAENFWPRVLPQSERG